jgi:hypothetical protein
LYTISELTGKEYRKVIPFIITSKIIKYLRVNLTKDVNDLYKKNYNPRKVERSPVFMDWQNQHSKNGLTIYMFNAVSCKIPVTFISVIEKIKRKFHLET